MRRLAVPLMGLLLSSTTGAGSEPVWFCTQCRDEYRVSVLPRLDELVACDALSPDPSVLLSDGCPVSGRIP